MKLKYYLSAILMYTSGTLFAITQNAEGVYEIGNATQLEEFAALVNNGNVNANAVLTANINMKGVKHTPIGNSKSLAYTGTFNGNFHTISSLVMNDAAGSNLALFGYIGAGAKLCNTVIDEYSEFIGENNCASFVGEAIGSQAGYATFECIGSGAKVHAYSTDSKGSQSEEQFVVQIPKWGRLRRRAARACPVEQPDGGHHSRPRVPALGGQRPEAAWLFRLLLGSLRRLL